jgi:ribosomal protein S25
MEKTFSRGGNPKDKMNIGINKDATTQERLANGLRRIYSDYKRDRMIDNLYGKYTEVLSIAYLRKLADLGFLQKMTKSKKKMIYTWSAGENPDFVELASKLMMGIRITEHKEFPSKVDKTIEVAILLKEEGIDKDKVNELAKKIINIFYPE